mmetsp:Transcript_11012/g.16533  ORF Transcript_11012/g.16533 Transcript_11012/m.16533 type:complete len:534 (+) Transcript_11012:319-1920(+)
MILKLLVLYPQTVEALVALVPHYGSFKDWFQLAALADKEKTDDMISFRNTILNLAAEQLLKDEETLDKMQKLSSGDPGISLLAKWAPRDKGHFKKQVSDLANKLFPNSRAPKKAYRQLLSRLGTALNSPEKMMCSNQCDESDFVHITSTCLGKNRKTFMSEKISSPVQSLVEEETANCHRADSRRVSCGNRLRKFMFQNKIVMFRRESVSKVMRGANKLSTLEKDLLTCQWSDIRANVLTSIERVKDIGMNASGASVSSSSGVDMGNIFSLVDVSVSESMNGIPKAAENLASEISKPAFTDRFLTFSGNPTWFQMDAKMCYSKMVQLIQNVPWGINTDYGKATEKILEVAVEARMKPGDIPILLVISDTQFELARAAHYNSYKMRSDKGWETRQQKVVRRFKGEGVKTSGEEWPATHLLFWYPRGNNLGFPLQGDTSNLTVLSGFSPVIMKPLLDGEALEEYGSVMNDKEENATNVALDPFTIFRTVLDDDNYSKVRKVLHDSSEGPLRLYRISENLINDGVGDIDEDWEFVN